MKIRIVLNGRVREIDDTTTIAQLLLTLEQKPALLAVERNQRIVPKALHATTCLADGDQIEIVTFVGGG